jgi:hypothetical protein
VAARSTAPTLIGTTAPPSATDAVLQAVQRAVTTAQLFKTLAGLVIGLVVTGLAVYAHFAKASELRELACKVVEQNQINNETITAAREIRSALKLLKENFEAPSDKPLSAQFMAREIAATVARLDGSLERIERTRQTAQAHAIKKEAGC